MISCFSSCAANRKRLYFRQMAKVPAFVKAKEEIVRRRILQMERALYWYKLLSLKSLGNSELAESSSVFHLHNLGF